MSEPPLHTLERWEEHGAIWRTVSLGQKEAIVLADVFCREARVRIREHFHTLFGPNDPAIYRLAQQVLKGEHRWLEQGIVGLSPLGSAATSAMPSPSERRETGQTVGV